MEKLKRCPFCGGEAYLENSHRAFIDGKTSRVSLVRCKRCNARSGRVLHSDYGKNCNCLEADRLAVQYWNRRVGE